MAVPGRIRLRLALAIVLTALIPVIVAILLATSMVRKTSERFFDPELAARLDQSLDLNQELVRAVKASMRYQADAIAADAALRRNASQRDRAGLERELRRCLERYPNLVSLAVRDAEQELAASANRGRPLDPAREYRLEVVRRLSDETPAPSPDEDTEQPAGPELVAVFAAERARFDQLDEMSQFVDFFRQISQRRQADEASYLYAFAALLGITILAAIGVGTLLARGVSRRIADLALATQRVGAGDLEIRVPDHGGDEIADLARAFNRMVSEVESSRARIEYLRRIGAWQEMARRLAHEIKNPLTPIQLAVQEIHRRYRGEDDRYRTLLDSTLEMVEDEVGTLRRLVTEFSGFARLPQAELKPADLGDFLREQSDQLSLLELGLGESDGPAEFAPASASLRWFVPAGPAQAQVDRQMLRRALINLIRNAAQAIAHSGRPGRIEVRLGRDGDYFVIDIDDDGPGIPEALRDSIFDPYVTTKAEGTGLGLAIAKKIVVEHGGSLVAQPSPLGGARLRLRLPRAGTLASRAALESRDHGPPSSRRPDWGNADRTA